MDIEPIPHFPVALINDIRRKALDAHLQVRLLQHGIPQVPLFPNNVPWPSDQIMPSAPTNRKALAFYARHGLTTLMEAAFKKLEAIVLMTCKYCLKVQLGLCPVLDRHAPRPREPLTITDNTGTYALTFDCRRCEMTVLRRCSTTSPARK